MEPINTPSSERHLGLDLSTRHLRALIAMPTEAAARRTLDAVSLVTGVSLNSHFTVGQFTTAFELISEGLGVTVAPSVFFARPHPADVSSRPLNAPGAVQRLGIITRRDRVLTPAKLFRSVDQANSSAQFAVRLSLTDDPSTPGRPSASTGTG